MKKYLILLIVLMFHSCIIPVVDFAFNIPVANYSDSTVYVCASCSDTLEKGRNLQLKEYSVVKKEYKYPHYRIEKDTIGCVTFRDRKVEQIFNRCKDRKMRFYFILESTMREYSWEEICENQMYEKRLTLTKEDLEKTDWVVIYE